MNVIDEIKSKIDIVDVVSETVKLRRSGRTLIGSCPFHTERTPSFVVWPETGTWRCFGACNTGGDVFAFVMKREHWDFGEALRELARRAGVELAPPTPAQQVAAEQAERLRAALAAAATYYHHLLLNAPQAHGARDYLARRGLTSQTIASFQLGYSLDDWHAAQNYLGSRGFSAQELIQAGLLTERAAGSRYDRFRGRLMFPIHDGRGQICGFGARTLGSDEPKYLNSPQTPLFDKSATLYALDKARAAIRQSNQAVIVEGYMDAIVAHQAGFANVVASMGTALTEAQFKQLTRLTKKLVLALDPDTAGMHSMLRGLDVARSTLDREVKPVFNARGLVSFESRLQADIRVAVMPQQLDPDEVILANPQQWVGLIGGALPVIEYVIQTLAAERNLNDPKEKNALAQQVIPLIQDVADASERAVYAQRLARVIGADAYVLQRQLAGPSLPARKARAERPDAAGSTPPQREAVNLETYCLAALLRSPEALAAIDDTFDQVNLPHLAADDFTALTHARIFALIRRSYEQLEGAALTDHLRAQLEEPLAAALDEIEAMPPLPGGQPIEGAVQSALRLRRRNVETRQRELHLLIQSLAEAQADEARRYIEAQRDNTETLRKLDRVMRSHEWFRQNTLAPY